MSGDALYPLTLEPIPAEQFQDRSGRPWPAGEVPEGNLGTLWLATDISRVAAGPHAGRGLGYLRHLWGADLVGHNAGEKPDAPLPIELKLKNTGETAQMLSLSDYSLWYVLAVAEEASLRAGFPEDLASFETEFNPGRWPEIMPKFAAEAGRCLWLPSGRPLFLEPGLTLAQIGPPAHPLPAWPSEGSSPDLAQPPVWLVPEAAGPEEAVFFQDEQLSVRLITTTQRSGLTASEALTFIWPLTGQGRVLTQGPAPATRLSPGRAVLLPAALGRYAVQTAGVISYLLIESR